MFGKMLVTGANGVATVEKADNDEDGKQKFTRL
jgi:hypothetical protein